MSPSFVRFGNFEILARQGEHDLLKRLSDFVIAAHFPGRSYAEFLFEVARRTARTVAHWMRVGFVHGVMNTDNMSILGLTLDYGPYGWLEPFEPQWTPNTTDAENRRYAFGNQPGIALWNLARLAEALGPLIRDQTVLEKSLDVFRETFGQTHTKMVSEKLGFQDARLADEEWVSELFALMELAQVDYILFFRALSNWDLTGDLFARLSDTFYLETIPPELQARFTKWIQWYSDRLTKEGVSSSERMRKMKRVNPKYVLRNYLAQEAIQAAEACDYTRIHRLLRVLEHPYDEQPDEEDLAKKRPDWAKNSPGSSTLSCSS